MIVHRGANATISAVETGDDVRTSAAGGWTPNVRFGFALDYLRKLLARRRLGAPSGEGRSLYLFQYDDYAQREVRSVGFGRIANEASFVSLLPDPYFLNSNGFQDLRARASGKQLPAWSERTNAVFWRGSGTHNLDNAAGRRIVDLTDIPRVQMALRLRDRPRANVGLTAAWKDQPPEETLGFYRRERILAEPVPMHAHARYRFQMDIDGVGNAWATLERFLCGSCVLKVWTPFEMWYYPQMQPWRHYVPVRADLADLEEKLDWCLSHQSEAQAIGERAQQLALSLTFEAAEAQAQAAIAACRIPLP